MKKSSLDRVALVALAIVAMTSADRARAESSDTRRIEDVEKENAALRARVRRLEAERENTNLRAKIERLEARRSGAPAEASQPIPATAPAPRLEASAPERTLILADMPVKALPVKASPPVSDWSGIYLGVEGGYGWGRQGLNALFPQDCCFAGGPFAFPAVAIQSNRQNGWLFGGSAGAQKQWGGWVLGIEADFDAVDLKNSALATATSLFNGAGGGAGPQILICGNQITLCLTTTVASTSKIDALGSLRGKFGFVPAPNLFIYGTGGLGFAHAQNFFTLSETAQNGLGAAAPVSTVVRTGGTSMLGWTAGAGIDWKWPTDAGSAWVFGIEYLHYDFGTQTITVSDNAGASSAFHTSVSADAVKGRISYLFNIH